MSEVRYEHDEEVMTPPEQMKSIFSGWWNQESSLESNSSFQYLTPEESKKFGPRPAYRHHAGPCRSSTKEGTLVPFGHCAICGNQMCIPHSKEQQKLPPVITTDECRNQGPGRKYRDHSGPCRGAASKEAMIPNGHCSTCGQHMPRPHSCNEHKKADSGGPNDDPVIKCDICGSYLAS